MARALRGALLLWAAVTLAVPAAKCLAQTGGLSGGGAPVTQQMRPGTGAGAAGGSALVIGPEVKAPAPPGDSGNTIAPPPPPPLEPSVQAPSGQAQTGPQPVEHPYLGISVRYATTNRDGEQIRGLEVVGVDPNSPAARAGLNAHSAMTTLGASGTTAGELLGPVSLALKPLLAKSGALGRNGDIIIALDDNRVSNEFELENALVGLSPGDTVYLTVIRTLKHGSTRTLKVPVMLGKAPPALENATARDPYAGAPPP